MRKFTSIHEITFIDVFDLLEQWAQDTYETEDVLTWVESVYDLNHGDRPTYARNHPRSILFAVLEMLELVYINPILKEDIPTLKMFLQIGQSDPILAWKEIDAYGESIDWDARVLEQYKKIQQNTINTQPPQV